MIRRLTDPVRVHELAAMQGVAGDFTELLSEPSHVCLCDGENMAFFAWRGPGIYELHLCFSARGRAAMNLLADMLRTMREAHGAKLFWALIPVESRRVVMFARLMGWKRFGEQLTRLGKHELFVSETNLCL